MATEVIIPALGEVVEEITIISWLKSEGDHVEKGEILLEVESEKVNVEIESPESGIVGRILYSEGAKVPIGFVVAVIIAEGESIPEKYRIIITEAASSASIVASTQDKLQGKRLDRIRVAPSAKKYAQLKGVNLSQVSPTGPHGTIIKKDVMTYLSFLNQQKDLSSISQKPQETEVEDNIKVSTLARRYAEKEGVSLGSIKGTGVRGRIMRTDIEQIVNEAASPGIGKVIKMGSKRQVIARRMSESAITAPHIYFFSEIWMDPLLKFRKEILSDFEAKSGKKPSINDFLIKAVALNLLEFPILNAMVKDQEIHIFPEVNVGLAVALPDGLIVPAIKNADRAKLDDIVRQRIDLVQRARLGKLTMEEIERGTFTISSLAQFDIDYFTAIINPPQSGILSVGKTRDELYLDSGTVMTRKTATFGLSVDHRIIDGAIAAEFMQNLKAKLEKQTFTFLHY